MGIKTTTKSKNKTKMTGDESIFWFGFVVIEMGEMAKKTNEEVEQTIVFLSVKELK